MVFFLFLAACGIAASTARFFPTGQWYLELNRPDWAPPNWVFPVAWSAIYLLATMAGARVAGLPGSGIAIALWAVQIALNTLWTPVFFGLHHLRAGAVIIVAMWVVVAAALIAHWRIDWIAGLCFVPYLAWLTLAGALNVWIWRNNPDVAPLAVNR